MTSMDMKERGMRIRRLRQARGVSALKLSKYMGISRASFNRMELGERDMRCFEAIKIAECLNVHPSQVIGYHPPEMNEEHVYKLAIDLGFEVVTQADGRITISPRLYNFAQAVVSQAHL